MNKQQGVALLIALSVTLILGIFLTNNFERNRTNLKLLSNAESQFSLNTINFSILRAVTLAIKKNGANYVYDFISILGSIPDFPINITQAPNINIYNPKVWSMEHYYYLNRDYKNSAEERLFNGILNQNLAKSIFLTGNGNIALTDKSIIGELKNWHTNSQNSNFVAQFPIYRRGSYFDLESEFYFLIKQMLKKKKARLDKDLNNELTFRIYSTEGQKNTKLNKDLSSKSECSLSPLNLNMLPKNSKRKAETIITDYLAWFSFHTSNKCKNIQKNKKIILDSINRRFYADRDGVYLITDIGKNNFNNKLHGFQADNAAKVHFTYRSHLIGVSYEVANRATYIKVNIHFYLEYKSNNSTDLPDSIHILYYNIS